MKSAIGKGFTREDHPSVSNQLYAAYAAGKDADAMRTVVGVEALTEEQRTHLKFMQLFEEDFLSQGHDESRPIFDSLDRAWSLLRVLGASMLKKIPQRFIDTYFAGQSADMVRGTEGAFGRGSG